MAPMVCLPDISMPRTDAACPYARRRERSRGIGGKLRAAELRQMSIARTRPESSYNTPPASPVSTPDGPIDLRYPNSPESSLCARIHIDRDNQWIIAKRRQGLLNIVARTIALVRRNHILEKKVEALRLETRSFISSVLNNPENKGNERRGEPTVCSVDSKMSDEVSSSTHEEFERSCPMPLGAFEAHRDEARRKICTDQTSAVTSSRSNSTSSERETRSPDLLDR